VGFHKFPQKGVDDFFEVIYLRYESGILIITVNRNFEGWGVLFGDKVIAFTIIERIVYHALLIKGGKYCIKNKVKE